MKDLNLIATDFEYKDTRQAIYTLVSVAFAEESLSKSIWLYQDRLRKEKVKQYLLARRESHIFLSFNVDAEAKGFIALGLNPIKFKWIDLQAEWKMLTNHNDRLGYGKHLIEGTLKTTYRRSYGDSEDKRPHDKTPVNLLGCMYKLLKNVGPEDFKHKKEMVKLILSKKIYNNEDKEKILSYGESDVADLIDLFYKMQKEYKKLPYSPTLEEMLFRGETVARAAVISSIGYPVNREKVVTFTKNIPKIVKDVQEDILYQFPDMLVFKWNKKENRYSLNTKVVKKWISESPYKDRWDLTPNKDYSLKLESWEKHFSFRHDFPRNNFAAQFLRYKKIEKNLNGFKPKSVTARNKDTFFSFYGDDDRAHPYLNAYGAQSGRYQPKATGFIHLKSAWMRSLVEPKPGKAICAIDYGSEEFLLAALMSGDKNMLKAYESGDVYLYFAKLAGAVPWEGSKSDYKKERDLFKATTLGISYQMGSLSLSLKITADTGIKTTQEEAQDLINKFYTAYPKYASWIEDNEIDYCENDYLKLADGWTMYGDNDNRRSVGNMPIQGMGSCILRKAIQLCQDAGLTVILPLHDALYIEYDVADIYAVETFAQCMQDAFAFYFTGKEKELAYDLIRLDINVWSPDYEDGYLNIGKLKKIKTQKIYIDERSEAEYRSFSKYFSQ